MNPETIDVDQPVYSLKQLTVYFWKLGAIGFGGPIALIGYMHRDLVEERQWISEAGYQEGLTLAQVAPGPLAAQLSFYLGYIHYGVLGSLMVVITTGFIGFLVAGFPGACVAAIAVFVPCYLLTIIPAPYFKKHGKNPGISAFVKGVTVAATGAIAGAVGVLGQQSLRDIPTILIGLITLVCLGKFGKKLPEPLVVAIAAVVGLVVYPLMNP